MAAQRLVRGAFTALLVAAMPGLLVAQSSIFGVRGLGHPGRPLTPAARATGGSFAPFDAESDGNPAALGQMRVVTGNFVMAPTWRRWESPAGDASLRESRFPLVSVGGPVPGTRVGLGVAFGSYADRDFRLSSTDTILVRGVPVGVNDTLSSLGGLNEIRFGAGMVLGKRTLVGAAAYWITGSSRMEARRSFADTSFISVRQSAELSYQGFGLSLGLIHEVRNNLRVSLYARSDGKVDVDRDSSGVTSIDLPYTIGAGVQFRPHRRLTLAGAGVYRTWSGANSDFQAQGGAGADNTLDLSFGGEWVRNTRRSTSLPLRFGVRYAQLPFPLDAGDQPHEVTLSMGTGLRFAQERAGFDVSLEQAFRSASGAYKERAFSLVLGLSVRPYGSR